MESNNFRVLIVDDERSITMLLSRILGEDGYEVRTALSGEEAKGIISAFAPNLVITDLRMPGMSGLDLMKQVRAGRPEIDFIILTAFATVENAVQAMKEGAFDYLLKPLRDPDELRIAVAKVVERQRLVASDVLWRDRLADGLPPTEVLFAGMEHVWGEVSRVAATDATVLLQGESGTGKSLVAKAIHHLSGRQGPFVDLNCAAIPENLIESELFGHERGAFTGAVKTKRGKFELAHEGTIFLDEIGEMPLAAQAKLLRILQERAFERVGGTSTHTTNARVVAATNQDLKDLMRERRFREDLYYRLNVFPIVLPPLRERPGAVGVLSRYLVQVISAKVGKRVGELTPEMIGRLETYSWPGNVRELYNVLERAIILSNEGELQIHEPGGRGKAEETGRQEPLVLSLKELERKAIDKALEKTGGHRRKAAELLGISLRTLQYKLKQYGLGRSRGEGGT